MASKLDIVPDHQDRPLIPSRRDRQEEQVCNDAAQILQDEVTRYQAGVKQLQILRARAAQRRVDGAKSVRSRTFRAMSTAGFSPSSVTTGGCYAVLGLWTDDKFRGHLSRFEVKEVLSMVAEALGIGAFSAFISQNLAELGTSLMEFLEWAVPSIKGKLKPTLMIGFLIQLLFLLFVCWRGRDIEKQELGGVVLNALVSSFFAFVLHGAGAVVAATGVKKTLENMQARYYRGEPWYKIIFGGMGDTVEQTFKLVVSMVTFTWGLASAFWNWDWRNEDERTMDKLIEQAALKKMDAREASYVALFEAEVHFAFMCPLTLELVVDPVLVHGHLFERKEIQNVYQQERNIQTGRCRHPITRNDFTALDIANPPPEYCQLLARYVELRLLAQRQAKA
eukprot:g82169.t1